MDKKKIQCFGILRFGYVPLLALLLVFASCSKDDPQPVLPELPEPGGGNSDFDLAAVDDPITDFMARYNVPGASVAISRQGKLVYAKGYGWADSEAATPVDTSSLFRIASLSKFVTSVGIMTMIDKGQLSMSDKVFGPGSILGTEFGDLPYPQHITDITLRNVLQHEIGGWNNTSGDPAFQQSAMDSRQLISWTINNRPLTESPGTKLDYSNLGYLILGRIIEEVSGKSYVEYIQQEVFNKAGIKNMQIAGGSLADRKPNEVKYYGQHGQNPYGYATGVIPRLDACGGWIASAIDYLRMVVHVDGLPSPSDILSPSTIEVMSTPSENSVYACGIRISAVNKNWWHGGGLSGTRTWMVKASNGFAWTIFFNTRNTSEGFDNAVNELVWPAVNNASTNWPDVDLF
ncbi:serine hydrolase domain-containing protein [Parapedobacter tibetensis]|uniref:serine hydrolase domain-containing protein n=1 Tax=Parapedobacter tibetensis TaxID=2972951 RepID=UPI00214D4BE3|nr:serine hydrolase domain-containing protein [Parapedobacter tibetensis]